MLSEMILRLMRREDLTRSEAFGFIAQVLQGANEHQVSACLALLHAKGETAEELAGLVEGMRFVERSVKLVRQAVDIVGTGGDMAGTVNISTGASVLASACGVPIAKSGNRSVSSRCGSADLLEELGIVIDLTPTQAERCFERIGIVFLFAPRFHPATKHVAPIRRALRVPTAFNLLGPLLNPARPKHQVIGVANPSLLQTLASTLQLLGTEHALVVHGSGLDELTPLGEIDLIEITPGEMRHLTLDPLEFGFERCPLERLRGGDVAHNIQLIRAALAGEGGPIANSLILTAAAALYVYGKVPTISEGVSLARQIQQSGAASHVLEKWATVTRSIVEEVS